LLLLDFHVSGSGQCGEALSVILHGLPRTG
jgi:hypothetical protein